MRRHKGYIGGGRKKNYEQRDIVLPTEWKIGEIRHRGTPVFPRINLHVRILEWVMTV